MKHVDIYTDGACRGNPGKGGWGAILVYGKTEKELSGGEPSTTNNRMELTAAIKALSALKEKMTLGVTLKANDNFDDGFRISVNNGSAYYDYSAEAVIDMLSNYLSPKITALLKEAE